MAVFPCPTKSLCVDPSTPFANLSAEAPDAEIYIGYNWGYGPSYPPLGSDFTETGCLGTCQSEVSQQDADICAANQNAACTSVIFPVSTVVPDVFGHPAVLNRPRPLYRNSPQMATVLCPDGNPFVYTVPAGVFTAFNQATADATALSWAQDQAALFMVCLGDLSNPKVCAGSEYTDSITASGNFLASPPGANVWEIVTGSLPPGITITEFIFNTGLVVGNTIHFTGTCNVPGVYPFMLQVTDSQGDVMVKPYSITVAGIDNGFALEDGMVGTAYSQDVTSAGVTNPIYSLEAGALPDGLSLDPLSGTISGTPTVVDVFDFTLGVTEAGTGVTCDSPAEIVVTASINWNDLVWVIPVVPDDGSGEDPYGTFQQNNFQIPFSGYFDNQLNNSASMPFDGGPVNCNLQVTITALGPDYNPNPNTTQIDLLIQDQNANTYFSTVGNNWPTPGIFNFPFIIPALSGATLTLSLTVACQNGDPNSTFSVSAIVTPAS